MIELNDKKVMQYVGMDHMLVAVDCIIFGFEDNQLKLLLIKRNFKPEKGKWSLMGGFLKKDESCDDASDRILYQLTGLANVYLEQFYSYSDVKRDPVERTISVAYYALINIQQHNRELIKKYGAKWFSIDNFPHLIFDHLEMVRYAEERLNYKASYYPVGFELLPKKFTIPQLQNLYEAIYKKSLDKRNFKRRILGLDILIKLDEKQKGFSKKGAYFYKFDKTRYNKLLSRGLSYIMKP